VRTSQKLSLLLPAALAVLCGPAPAAGDLTISEITYRRDKASAPGFAVENRFYRAVLVPDMGGRIVEWLDQTTERNVVYDNKYGGLLDDHGARYLQPYAAEWLQRGPQEAALQLTLADETAVYRKTVRFFARRPSLQVDYHIENLSQDPLRLLFRNVVRPGGTEFSGAELYCYSRVAGLQRARGMPRTDDQADPWCALVHPGRKVVVANSFEGDALERLYTWQGSKVAPTYEFMFHQLQAGRQMDVRYYWHLCHGLTAVDYAHRNFVVQIEGELAGASLRVQLLAAAVWAPLPDLRISGEILNAKRAVVAKIPSRPFPLNELDKVVRLPVEAALPGPEEYAILVLTAESGGLPEKVVIEKAFPRGGDAKLLADYARPVRWLGPHVEQKPVPGWVKEVKYVIQPADADRERGCMVFEETGEGRGRHVTEIGFDLMQGEPEGFSLHFHSIDIDGGVRITTGTPPGIELETFVPEKVPEKLWGRVRHGLKLIPGASFVTSKGEDRVLFFRLRAAAGAAPGNHVAQIKFEVENGPSLAVALRTVLHPIRFARHPYMVFDVNNVVNYLCARKETKWKYVWDETRARNYLLDMELHGVRTQTMVGVNAPNAHYSYDLVKDRSTGLPLPEAIKQAPDRFRTMDMPHLDFSYWDWLVDRLLQHGMTRVKWPMGGCGDRFMQGHAKLTKLIYGRTFPPGDLRQMAVQEWYYGELVRYLKDRGVARVLCTIDDEIPSEKLSWWCQHAFRCIQMGMTPGVTQSAKTIASDTLMNMIAPYMRYWIIGTLQRENMALRRSQNIIKPEHWVTTYHSSANHWREYDEMRRHCGIRNSFFDLDACWIQVYYRWRQSEAVIYPGEQGPTSSAAWEAARDGLDDANLHLLAKTLIRALPDKAARRTYTDRLEAVVGTRDDALVRFVDKLSSVGMTTQIDGKPDAARLREVKHRLIELVLELGRQVPVQKANVRLRGRDLIVDGASVFQIPEGMTWTARVLKFLSEAASPLEFVAPAPAPVDPKAPYPVFFCGSWNELQKLLPALASHPDLAGVDASYPAPGGYALRFLSKPAKRAKDAPPSPVSLVLICPDEAAIDKALTNLSNVLTTPKTQYSHWLPGHWGR